MPDDKSLSHGRVLAGKRNSCWDGGPAPHRAVVGASADCRGAGQNRRFHRPADDDLYREPILLGMLRYGVKG